MEAERQNYYNMKLRQSRTALEDLYTAVQRIDSMHRKSVSWSVVQNLYFVGEVHLWEYLFNGANTYVGKAYDD